MMFSIGRMNELHGGEKLDRGLRLMEWKRVVLVICVVVLLGSAIGCGRKAIEDSDGWQKQTSIAVTSQSYQNEGGNKIIYYCCKTTYHKESRKPKIGMLDRQALSAVIDWEKAEGEIECSVSEWPALWCQRDGRSYLCWTISPEYSCVIEYDAAVVSQEDIVHMAKSVVQQ